MQKLEAACKKQGVELVLATLVFVIESALPGTFTYRLTTAEKDQPELTKADRMGTRWTFGTWCCCACLPDTPGAHCVVFNDTRENLDLCIQPNLAQQAQTGSKSAVVTDIVRSGYEKIFDLTQKKMYLTWARYVDPAYQLFAAKHQPIEDGFRYVIQASDIEVQQGTVSEEKWTKAEF